MSKKIALIDGYSFVFRAYYSLPPLTRPDGTPVGAVYGFTNMLIKLLAGLNVSHVAVVLDSGSKTFRNEIYPEYKANRPECPEDLKPQFPIIRESAESLNLPILEKNNYEADDIIATIAKKAANEDYEVVILSSDKDLMQLVNDKVFMYDSMKNKFIKEEQVLEKFSVKPEKVLDILSLMGDSSDNIPGVKGIGPKTAAELINEFGSLENIFNNLDKIKQNKRRQYLEEGQENAKISKTLASLKYDVDVGINDIDDLKLQEIDPNKLVSFLNEQGFRSLVSRVKKEFGISGNIESNNSQMANVNKEISQMTLFNNTKKIAIKSANDIKILENKAKENGVVTIDFFENFLTISTNKFNQNPEEIYYFEFSSQKEKENLNSDLFSFDQTKKDSTKLSLNILDNILHDSTIKKIFFDAKNFFRKIYLKNFDRIENIAFEDVLLINHLINSAIKNELREIIDFNLNEDIEELGLGKILDEISKNKVPESFVDEEKKIAALTFKNFAIASLYNILSPKIFSLKLNEAYQIYEKPLLKVLAIMESNGVKIDVAKLKELSDEFLVRINKLSQEIYEIAGEEFNIASPQQLGKILFEKLGLESKKKSKKTKALSTGVKVLEELEEQGHQIARKILEFRKFSKLKNTYTDALPKEINQETNRVHSHFSTTSTITGRLSSSNPNLQNIPIRSEDGRKIRKCFISENNNVLISADYSQIELRVIAHVAKIDSLIEAFKEDKDIHQITAAEVFDLKEDEVTKEYRSKAKAINFGIIYGISGFGLAKQLGISNTQAKDYIDSYLKTYPGIDNYMQEYIEFARTNGFVKTLSGRKCFIKNINDKNPIIRNEAERLAINAPIQGSAADIVKKAMISLNDRIRQENLDAKIILQIHDELIIETKESNSEAIKQVLEEEMSKATILDCPLKIDFSIKNFWD